MGRRVQEAITTMGVASPRAAALQVREILAELERLVSPESEYKGSSHAERWKRAAEECVSNRDRQRSLADRAPLAAKLNNALSAAGKQPRRGVEPSFDADRTRQFIRATINLVRDWVIALRSSGWTPQTLAERGRDGTGAQA
jgi:hypothetical protein